jgi:hypothetical protein
MIPRTCLALALIALGACGSGILSSGSGGPSSQQFTREVEAVPANLVQAAVTTFGRYGIPIAEADEPGGTLRTLPVNLRSLAGRFDEAPVTCPQGTASDAAARFTFDVKVRRTDKGSAISLGTERRDDTGCVVRSAFVSALLDEIAATVRDTSR